MVTKGFAIHGADRYMEGGHKRKLLLQSPEQAVVHPLRLGVVGLRYTIADHFSAEGAESGERFEVLKVIEGNFGKI